MSRKTIDDLERRIAKIDSVVDSIKKIMPTMYLSKGDFQEILKTDERIRIQRKILHMMYICVFLLVLIMIMQFASFGKQ